jgi:hypothetical protein
MNLVFQEVEGFTDAITDLLQDEEYAELQRELLLNPEKGKVIPGTGGARKIRAKGGGKGKSGGIRVIYYFQHEERIWFLDAYAKSKKENLTEKEKKILRLIVEEIKEGPHE